MGNKLGRKRQVLEEKYTRPQGLYQVKDVDYKKLRKLILESKLAPCYPGGDECDCSVLEECPICFLYYPTLNCSRCCMKSICTECFLQMKNPDSARPTQCPFCKTSNYAVEYRGVKSKEERGLEQIEEQKVIEAKIRMQQKELSEERQRIHNRQEISSSGRVTGEEEAEGITSSVTESLEGISSQASQAVTVLRQPQYFRQSRDNEFDLDLEDIMVMEAIWLSIQENGRSQQASEADVCAEPDAHVVVAGSSSLPSGGLACAIATLAERQQMGGSILSDYDRTMSDACFVPSAGTSGRAEQVQGDRPSAECDDEQLTNEARIAMLGDGEYWTLDHKYNMAEEPPSFANSDELCNCGAASALPSPPPPALVSSSQISRARYSSSDATGHGSVPLSPPLPPHSAQSNYNSIPSSMIPESFEEQMMLAIAASLSEAGATVTSSGVAWQ